MAVSQETIIVQPARKLRGAALARMLALVVVLLLGFGIRLYDLKDAPLDFHPTRQLRSMILARGFYYQASPALDPDLRARAMELAASMEAYEPPIFEAVVGLTYRLIGQESFWVARIYNALFWAVGGLALFLLARRFVSFYPALVGLMFYGFLPFAIIAGRSFQPDPWMVMWLALAMWAAYRWTEAQSWRWALLTGAFSGLAVLIKAFAAFPVAGVLVGVVLAGPGIRKAARSRQVWAVAALAAAPVLLYYLIGLGARSGEFLSFWTVSLSRMVLTSQFYSGWLGMVHGLMGLTTVLLALLGVLLAPRLPRALLLGGWVGYGVYGLVFPYQMTTHEYYHLMLLPLVALSLGPVAQAVFTRLAEQGVIWRAAAVGLFLFAAGYPLYAARSVLYVADYHNEVTSWTRMGEALPQNGKMIALTSEYGNRLKYYGWRSIAAYWPFQADLRLSQLAGNEAMDTRSYFESATQGMDYFLVTAFGELDAQPELKALLDGYPVAAEGDGFVLYALRR